MDSKQRASLRSSANGLEPCYYIGKDGIDDSLVRGIGEALKARELIKCSVQENCPCSPKEAANEIAPMLGAEVVQVIGRRFVLYKRNREIDRYGI